MADREVNYPSPSLKRSAYEIEGFCDSGTSPSNIQGLSPEFSTAKRSRNGPGAEPLEVEFEDHLNGGLSVLGSPTQTQIHIAGPLSESGPAGDHLLNIEGNVDTNGSSDNSHMYDDFAGIHGVAFPNDDCLKKSKHHAHHGHHHHHHGDHHGYHHNGETHHRHHSTSESVRHERHRNFSENHQTSHRHRSCSESHAGEAHSSSEDHSGSHRHTSSSSDTVPHAIPDNLPQSSLSETQPHKEQPQPSLDRNMVESGEAAGLEDEDNVSEISDLSGLSEEGWRPTAGPMAWVQRQMERGTDPRAILRSMVPQETEIPWDLNDFTLWRIIINLLSEPPKRKKLDTVNTLDDVLHLLRTCKKVMVLTGAGVSVSCGIPDFRSKDGIYSRLAVEYPDLPDPQAMFDIQYFRKNQGPFFKFAQEIYPGQFEPSVSHKFIKLLEDHGKLLRNYTQNIDTLEQIAGINKVIQCHGSFATATCMTCKYKVTCDAVKEDIMNHQIPRCPHCSSEEPLGIMKPDIVFFGESLPDEFHRLMEIDKDECDLLVVMGSSLKVRPVALIPNSLPAHVPQILINREPLRHLNFDVELLGDCDAIIEELCCRLGEGWSELSVRDSPLQQLLKDDMTTPPASSRHSPMSTINPQSEENSRMSFHVTCEDTRMSCQEEEEAAGITEACSADSKAACDSSLTALQRMDSQGSNLSAMSTTSAPLPGAPPSSPQESNPATTKDDPADSADKTSAEMEGVSSELEELRACWQPRVVNWGSRLKDGQFLFLPPCRYVFQGAEVYESNESDDESSSSSDNDSDCSSAMGDPLSPAPQPHKDSESSSGNKPHSQVALQEADSTSLRVEDVKVILDSGQLKKETTAFPNSSEPDTSGSTL